MQKIFQILGSNLNPVLTQIAKSKRVLIVEGKDFIIFSRLARILKLEQVANRSDFAVVPVEGFNPQRLKAFKLGIEKTIGTKIISAVIFDRDYRSDDEIKDELFELSKGSYFAHIHSCKELENFLIIPNAIESAINRRVTEYNNRTGNSISYKEDTNRLLRSISDSFKNKVFAQLQSKRFQYMKRIDPRVNDSTITERILAEFDLIWGDNNTRFKILPGKEFLSSLNEYLQCNYKITITYPNIISDISKADFPEEIKTLLMKINSFRKIHLTEDQDL